VLAILRAPFEPLARAAPAVPPALAAVIERCLAKDRELRWSSVEAMRRALESIDTSAMIVDVLGASEMSAPPIAAGEARVIAMLLAEGVTDNSALHDAIERRGGSFLPLMGSRAVGIFGGASWEGDEIDRAAAAAFDARTAAARIGVAAGRATSTGGEISGAVLKAAQRGCNAASEGVVADRSAARALTGAFELEELSDGAFVIRGPRGPGPAGALSAAARLGDSIPPGVVEPPLFGRTAELAQMQSAVESFLEERRAVAVLVVGAVGAGKSRLRSEMERLLARAGSGVRVFQARAMPLGQAHALALIAEALRREARIGALDHELASSEHGRDPAAAQAAVVVLTRAAIDDPKLAAETAPFVGELLGVAMPETPALAAARKDARLMADRLRVAVRDYFQGISERGPVAFLIENLQWADSSSLDLVEDLFASLVERQFLLFGTARPWLDETRPQFLDGFLAGYDVIRIEPHGLGARDVGALARAIAGKALSDSVVRALTDRTGGNPLFVEQIVLELEERGFLDAPPEELPLPVTVEAAIQSRLDHLPVLEKDAAKRAAILGRAFSVDEIEALGIADARMLLESLRKRGLIGARAPARVGSKHEYHFRSALVADVAYAMISQELLTRLHCRAAAHLATVSEPEDEEIASHYEKGGERAQAAKHYTQAALAAARRGDSETILRCSARALELGVPGERSRFALRMARADALKLLGRHAEQFGELGLAEPLAHAPAECAQVLGERARALWLLGRSEDAAAAAERAAVVARGIGDKDVEALALSWQAITLRYAGRLDEATARMASAQSAAEGGSVTTRAFVATAAAQLAAEALGDLAGAARQFQIAVELFTQSGDLRRASNDEMNLADLHNRVGDYDQAEAALRAAIPKCRRVGHRSAEAAAWINLGYALTRLGRCDEALDAFAAARSLVDSIDGRPDLRLAVDVYELRARLAQGASEPIASEARAVAIRAEQAQAPTYRIGALVLAARAALACGDAEGALADSEVALALRDQLGGVPEDEAEIFLVRAEALASRGSHVEADRVLARGRARVEEIASKIEDAELRLQFLDLPAHATLLHA